MICRCASRSERFSLALLSTQARRNDQLLWYKRDTELVLSWRRGKSELYESQMEQEYLHRHQPLNALLINTAHSFTEQLQSNCSNVEAGSSWKHDVIVTKTADLCQYVWSRTREQSDTGTAAGGSSCCLYWTLWSYVFDCKILWSKNLNFGTVFTKKWFLLLNFIKSLFLWPVKGRVPAPKILEIKLCLREPLNFVLYVTATELHLKSVCVARWWSGRVPDY